MENFLSRLNRNPYAPIDSASITRVDELGNGYDDWNNLIAPKLEAPQQTWGETALGVATAPARIATSLVESLSPYGAEGWQLPPIVNEGVNALTAVGDAYTGKMAPEDINNRALGMAGFMMGGGGLAARPGMSRGVNLFPDSPRVMDAEAGAFESLRDYGQAAYRTIRHPTETSVMGPMSEADIWDRFGMSPKIGSDLNNAPFWKDADGTLNMLYPDGPDTYGAFSGPNRLGNEAGSPGDVNAYRSKPMQPEFDVIDGGLYSNSDSRPALLAGLAGQEQRFMPFSAYQEATETGTSQALRGAEYALSPNPLLSGQTADGLQGRILSPGGQPVQASPSLMTDDPFPGSFGVTPDEIELLRGIYSRYGKLPSDWYVHGRAKSEKLRSDVPIQMTKDFDVMEQYGGRSGSGWAIAPADGAKVLDFTDTATPDMRSMAAKALNDLRSGGLPYIMEQDMDFAGTPRDKSEMIRNAFAPDDIVAGAGAYDDMRYSEWLYNRLSPDFIHTPDGAVAFNGPGIKAVRLFSNSDSRPALAWIAGQEYIQD